MKRLPLLTLLLLTAACRKAPAPAASANGLPVVARVAGEDLIDYDSADGTFRCRAPADWKALEFAHGGPAVMMVGPMQGPTRGKVSIAVTRYDGVKNPVRTPQEYWNAMRLAGRKPSPLEKRRVGDRDVYFVHVEKPEHPPESWKVLYMNREDVALVPAGKGFFEVAHTAPADAYAPTLPLFDAVVASLQAK